MTDIAGFGAVSDAIGWACRTRVNGRMEIRAGIGPLSGSIILFEGLVDLRLNVKHHALDGDGDEADVVCRIWQEEIPELRFSPDERRPGFVCVRALGTIEDLDRLAARRAEELRLARSPRKERRAAQKRARKGRA